MSDLKSYQPYNVKIEIPNSSTEEIVPCVMVSEHWSEPGHLYSVSLNELLDEVMQRYQFDKQALHCFSYFLLLKAQQFAQDDMQIQMLDE